MADESCKWYDVGCSLEWARDEAKELVLSWFHELLGALASVIEAIPMPSWATSGGSLFSSIPGSVGYFLSVMEFDFGVSVIASAYVLRFLIRRIPLIG